MEREVEVTRAVMPLKIAIVTEYYYPLIGGITENVHHTAAKLRAMGHTVKIITSRASRSGLPASEEVPDAADVIRIGHSMPLYTNGSVAHVTVGLHLWRELRDTFLRERFDIAHLHSPLVFTLPAMGVIASTCPCIGTFHTYFEGSVVYKRFRNLLQKQFLDRMDARTFVSRSCVESLQQYFTLKDPRIIPNGVDVDRFNPAAPRLPRFDPGKLTLLWLGRLEPRNGLGLMLKSFEIIKREFPDVRLIIVGHGLSRAYYERIVPRALRPDVHFEGPAVASRPAHYSTCDVFCSPVTKASFGITLLEAMASGKPIVASENVGYCDLLGPEEGILVPQNGPETFANAILQLLRDDRLRSEMGRAGLRKVARYSWDHVVGETLDLYEEILRTR
jgi:phosphatidyl-myo-inositol alpha-mannosyltransferase